MNESTNLSTYLLSNDDRIDGSSMSFAKINLRHQQGRSYNSSGGGGRGGVAIFSAPYNGGNDGCLGGDGGGYESTTSSTYNDDEGGDVVPTDEPDLGPVTETAPKNMSHVWLIGLGFLLATCLATYVFGKKRHY